MYLCMCHLSQSFTVSKTKMLYKYMHTLADEIKLTCIKMIVSSGFCNPQYTFCQSIVVKAIYAKVNDFIHN